MRNWLRKSLTSRSERPFNFPKRVLSHFTLLTSRVCKKKCRMNQRLILASLAEGARFQTDDHSWKPNLFAFMLQVNRIRPESHQTPLSRPTDLKRNKDQALVPTFCAVGSPPIGVICSIDCMISAGTRFFITSFSTITTRLPLTAPQVRYRCR